MQVEPPSQPIFRDPELARVRAHVAKRDPRGFLHHIAQLSGEYQLLGAIPLHAGRLDEQNVTAGTRDGQTSSYAGH